VILKTYDLCIYGDIQYIANSLCKNVLKIVKPLSRFWIEFLNVFFLLLSVYYFITHCAEKYVGEVICIILRILIILHSVYWVSCCMHAHQILLMLLAPHERSSRLGVQYSGLATGLKQSYHMQHKFLSVFSLQSLCLS